MAIRPRTVFIGTGQFGVPALRLLAASPDVELVAVVTAPPRPAGRHAAPRHSPIHQVARELGVGEVQAPERLRRPEAVAGVVALGPELIVLADYGQIVPAALLDVPLGALNLHPSLLPRHRGAAPIPATILAGDTRTGVTLMQMDAGLDTGPIAAVDEVVLTGAETAPELEADLAVRGAALLGRCLGPWIRGELISRPQETAGATLTRRLTRDDGRLDPGQAATPVERQVRAFQPWPGSWLDTSAGRLVIWRALVRRSAPAGPPGALAVTDGALVLATADGVLELAEVQPAGGRRMTGPALLRGHPDLAGASVVASPHRLRPPIERPVG